MFVPFTAFIVSKLRKSINVNFLYDSPNTYFRKETFSAREYLKGISELSMVLYIFLPTIEKKLICSGKIFSVPFVVYT